jgi:aryl-alcohol dehydrogenase-like predicted oxidoreductase
MLPSRENRRQFLRTGAASIAALSSGTACAAARVARSQDQVVLGRSDLRVSRLSLGLGTGKAVAFQNMGPAAFERLIRHALDNGVRYFDLVPGPIHRMLGDALRGVPRENYVLITNFRHPVIENPDEMIPQFLKELNTDYLDSVLLGGLTTADWAEHPKWDERRDLVSAAVEKGLVRARGVSIHGYGPLCSLADDRWVELAMVGCNHQGIYMYGPNTKNQNGVQRRDAALTETQRIRKSGIGTIAMKVFAHTGFLDNPNPAKERLRSIRFAMRSGCIDTMPIQCESIEEFDEVVSLVNRVGCELKNNA